MVIRRRRGLQPLLEAPPEFGHRALGVARRSERVSRTREEAEDVPHQPERPVGRGDRVGDHVRRRGDGQQPEYPPRHGGHPRQHVPVGDLLCDPRDRERHQGEGGEDRQCCEQRLAAMREPGELARCRDLACAVCRLLLELRILRSRAGGSVGRHDVLDTEQVLVLLRSWLRRAFGERQVGHREHREPPERGDRDDRRDGQHDDEHHEQGHREPHVEVRRGERDRGGARRCVRGIRCRRWKLPPELNVLRRLGRCRQPRVHADHEQARDHHRREQREQQDHRGGVAVPAGPGARCFLGPAVEEVSDAEGDSHDGDRRP